MARFSFYKTQRWQRLRQYIINRDGGICARCGQRGEIVHHKIVVSESNCNDPNVIYNSDHLELLCQACHNKEHHGSAEPCVEGLTFDNDGMLIEIATNL